MDEKALTALQGSIKKWENILAGTDADHGTENCPLCQLFMDTSAKVYCENCPVSLVTGQECCDGSPYEKWSDYHSEKGRWTKNGEYRVYEGEPKSVKLAQAELDFLRSLVPHTSATKESQ